MPDTEPEATNLPPLPTVRDHVAAAISEARWGGEQNVKLSDYDYRLADAAIIAYQREQPEPTR